MQFIKDNPYFVAIIFVAMMSIVTALLYAIDKYKAVRGDRRIPEATLLMFSLFGGGIGGFIAMMMTRHKTRGEHWYFRVVNLLGVIIAATLIVAAYVLL